MPWFDKALKSVQGTAEKAAFEADKLVRVNREQAALADLQKKLDGKLGELGQAALALYRAGTLIDPAIAALAEDIVGMEAQVKQQADKVEATRNEQYGAAAVPAAAAAPVPAQPPAVSVESAATSERLAAVPPVAPAAVTAECPNCHAQVKATAAFCPECGTRLK